MTVVEVINFFQGSLSLFKEKDIKNDFISDDAFL